MNRKILIECIIAIVAVAIFGTVLYLTLGDPVVDTSSITDITVYGVNSETTQVAVESLGAADIKKVKDVLDGKQKSSTVPDASFSEKCAFELFDGDSSSYYFLAVDGTNYIMCGNDDTYLTISEEEREVLVELLRKYCGYSEDEL